MMMKGSHMMESEANTEQTGCPGGIAVVKAGGITYVGGTVDADRVPV